jgi:hypothetical protein
VLHPYYFLGVGSSKRSPSIPLKKGEEDNLINSPPFKRGAEGITI